MIGSGSWGTAIAKLLSDKGNELVVWSFLDSETEMFRKHHENTERLPGVKLPEDVVFTSSLEEAIKDAELLVFAVPSPVVRSTAHNMSRFVKDNMQNGVTVETLADKMCITRGHLNRRVKNITGTTTQQYITRIRLEHARLLLEQDASLPITEVAMQCGFDDASSFTRAFKRTFGATPSQHRGTKN